MVISGSGLRTGWVLILGLRTELRLLLGLGLLLLLDLRWPMDWVASTDSLLLMFRLLKK